METKATCPTCDDQGGWMDGDLGVMTHWKVCPDCGPRAGSDLHEIVSELDEYYGAPGIDLDYRKVRKLINRLKYVESRIA